MIFRFMFGIKSKPTTSFFWSVFQNFFLCLGVLLVFYFGIASCYDLTNKEKPKFLSHTPKTVLGLDIVGGVQIVLKADIAWMLNHKYNTKMDLIREALEDAGMSSIYKIEVVKDPISKFPKHILIKSDPALIDSIYANLLVQLESIDSNLEAKIEKGVGIKCSYKNFYISSLSNEAVIQAMNIVRSRIDGTGSKEAAVYRIGKDAIGVDIPGIEDHDKVTRILGKTASLSFHLLDDINPFVLNPIQGYSDKYIFVQTKDGIGFYCIKKTPELIGSDLVDARVFSDSDIGVEFVLNKNGALKFADITREHIGKGLAILIDNEVLSAPIIRSQIPNGRGIINGNFTVQSAKELAMLLRSGSLPVPLKVVQERNIGPTIGLEAIDACKKAFLIGVGLVILFMVLYYKVMGIIAGFAILLNFFFILTVMSFLHITVSIPSFVGIILTLGMAVDANVLIYERIKDESKTFFANADKSKWMIKKSFKGAFAAIFDSNITTMLCALALFAIGSSFIKGFAIAIIIGLSTSMLTCVFLTQFCISGVFSNLTPKKLYQMSFYERF